MRIRLTVLTIVVLTLSMFHPLSGQISPFAGDWLGTLRIQSFSLRLVFHVQPLTDGGLTATMDSPDQGARGIPIDTVIVDGRSVRLLARGIGGEYAGALDAGDSSITGTWTQGGRTFDLGLVRTSAPVTVRRPQEPQPPFPYREEDLSWQGGAPGVTLSGTLTVPPGSGPFPAAVLISGSGPQDRDETVFNHRPFLIIADHLARHGIAVLRYDDRGTARSTGTFATATTIDFAGDAASAVRFLRTRTDVRSDAIGLIGHSEGGLIAPIVAPQEQAAFVVLLAAPAIPGREIIPLQDSLISVANGQDPAALRDRLSLTRQMFDVLVTEPDSVRRSARLAEVLRRIAIAAGDTGATPAESEAAVQAGVRRLSSPWFRTFAAHDPVPALRELRMPVLALNGERDLQVPAGVNLAGIEQALRVGGNQRATVRMLPGLNHLFQPSATGSPAEYATIETTFAPEALRTMSEWISDVMRKERR